MTGKRYRDLFVPAACFPRRDPLGRRSADFCSSGVLWGLSPAS